MTAQQAQIDRQSAGDGRRKRSTSLFRTDRSLPEWVTLSVSSLLILGLLGLALYDWFSATGERGVADINLTIGEVEPAGEQFHVRVGVTNAGRTGLERVRIEVTHRPPAGEPARREFEIDFLGSGATAEVVAVFAEDPRRGELSASVLSYSQP